AAHLPEQPQPVHPPARPALPQRPAGDERETERAPDDGRRGPVRPAADRALLRPAALLRSRHRDVGHQGVSVPIVDAHTHLFAPDQERSPLADPGASYRPETDGSVELLRRQMDAAGVDRALTISPWPYRWDMRYALDALADHRSWLAVAVLIDPRSPDGP